MNIFILIFLMITNITFAQTFNMQYNKVSANEIHFTTVYRGPSAEISLPRTGRIIALSEQENINVGGGKIRVGIRVGSDDTTGNEHVLRFTYALILPNQGGFGTINTHWFPTVKDGHATYNVTSLNANNEIFIYPNLEHQGNSFTFDSSQPSVKLVITPHSIEEYTETSPSITIFSTRKLQASSQEIINVYNYISENFGKKDIARIVIINNTLATENSFIDQDTIYLNITGIGTVDQLKSAFAVAWKGTFTHEILSARLFDMFQDTIFRLSPISIKSSSQEMNADDLVADNAISEEEKEEASTPIDLGNTVLVPPTTYYQELFYKGFATNEVQKVDVEGIFNNYALLHMAQYNIGTDTLVAGIKQYFQNPSGPKTELTNSSEEEEKETLSNTNIIKHNTNVKKLLIDTEQVDWNIITQNKLQDPLFKLYTKEVLTPKGLIPQITADKNVVTRNSYNIPDFNLIDIEGNKIPVKWNDFRSTTLKISNGSYQLDSERTVPQQSFIKSYYSFDTNTHILRNRLTFMAEKQKAPGEIAARQHLEITHFVAEDGNAFNVSTGDNVYVVISHILSNAVGSLKPAIKETFFTVNSEGKITYLATRLRI